MEQLNTHYYDTHIKSIYKELCILQNTYVLNENLFNELYESLEQINIVNGSKDTIKEMLKLIQNDSNNNYDSKNDIQTIDILDRTWAFVKKLPWSAKCKPPLGGFTLASNAGSNSVLKFEDHPLRGGGLNFGTIRYH
jgi:hypothetical protein